MIKGSWKTRVVEINGKKLSPIPSQRIWNHSPDGFNWSYSGSGPAQLALALLLHFSKDREFARQHHQHFKFKVIAALPQGDFEMDESMVTKYIEEMQAATKETES